MVSMPERLAREAILLRQQLQSRVGVPSLGAGPAGPPHVLAVVGTHYLLCARTPPSLGKSSSPTIRVSPLWLPLLKNKQVTQNTSTVGLGHGLAIPLVLLPAVAFTALPQMSCGVRSAGVLTSEFLSRNNVKSELLVARYHGVTFNCI